jgi:hemerythrin-like domain-containing protein
MSDRVGPEAGALKFFSADHRICDDLWTAVEAAVDAGDGARVASSFAAFDAAMRRHIDMEEQVLFPAFEEATGITMGPTRVMRAEHQQMRGLLDQMARAVGHDDGALVDHGDTLMMLIQQHNMKEEGMLYPMCDQHLYGAWPALAGKLARY